MTMTLVRTSLISFSVKHRCVHYKLVFPRSLLTYQGWVTPSSPAPFQYNSYGVVATEVEIDVLTGEQQIIRADILFDCGQRSAAFIKT